MRGHHVLDVAELLVPGEGEKWGAGVAATADPGRAEPPQPADFALVADDEAGAAG